jgi:hypothetical protein
MLDVDSFSWQKIKDRIRINWQTYKSHYVLFLVLVCIVMLQDTSSNCNIIKTHITNYSPTKTGIKAQIRKHKGGATNNNSNILQSAAAETDTATNNNQKELNNNEGLNSERGASSSAKGLCSGSGFFARICSGAGNGIGMVFKAIGFIFLAIAALLAPAVLYMALVFIILRIMFYGAREI